MQAPEGKDNIQNVWMEYKTLNCWKFT